MKKLIISLVCLASLANPLLALGTQKARYIEKEGSSGEICTVIDRIVDRALKEFQVPGGAVGVIVDGKLVYAKGFGYRDLEKQLPVTPETLFAIGSCTKAFTTFVLGSLVEEGVIEWDDRVIKHLPDFRLSDDYVTKNLTIRDLVTHRSGLARHDDVWYNTSLSRTELYHRLKDLEFESGLREKFHYSNLLYALAGLLIERVTGQSWENEVQKRIFTPLGMKFSNFSVDDSQKSNNFALPYEEQKEDVKKIPFRNICSIGPAGSINSTIVEMAQWVQLHLSNGTLMGKELIQESTLNEMHTLQFANADFPKNKTYILGYGLGWFIGNYEGHYLVEHSGCIDGFFAITSMLPHDKIGVIILTNSNSGGDFVKEVSKSIFDCLLGIEKIDCGDSSCASN